MVVVGGGGDVRHVIRDLWPPHVLPTRAGEGLGKPPCPGSGDIRNLTPTNNHTRHVSFRCLPLVGHVRPASLSLCCIAVLSLGRFVDREKPAVYWDIHRPLSQAERFVYLDSQRAACLGSRC